MVELSTAEVQLCEFTNIYRTCESKLEVCVCMRVCKQPRWGGVCGCVRQIYNTGPELWCSQLSFIICHLTTHEIHGITSPLPFCVKFSPCPPPPHTHTSNLFMGCSCTSVRMCLNAYIQGTYTPALPTYSYTSAAPLLCKPKRGRNWGEGERRKRRCFEEWGGMVLNVSILALNILCNSPSILKCSSENLMMKSDTCHVVIKNLCQWNTKCHMFFHKISCFTFCYS